MIRSSILYAADTYYDLNETELRELERKEEVFLRKLLKKSRSTLFVIWADSRSVRNNENDVYPESR
jgi:hypothetical protein